MRLLLSLSPFLLVPVLHAQTPLTAHPQESLTLGSGHLVPLGVTNNGSFGEGHTMILVPANELPTIPALILGIEVHAHQAVTIDYQTLDVNLGATNATALTATFASNYIGAPTTVMQGPTQVNYVTNAWTQILFTTPYLHDGVSALIIEIQKVVQPAASYPFVTMSTSTTPMRTDRPSMWHTFSTPGGGASTAPVANYSANALAFRLLWSGTPTVRNRSDVGPGQSQYGIGGSVTLTMNGPANNLFVLAAATSFLPTPVPVPGLSGALLLNSPVIFASGLLDPTGAATQLVPIPADPLLVGFYLAYQGATVDPVTVGITLTNGTDHFINP